MQHRTVPLSAESRESTGARLPLSIALGVALVLAACGGGGDTSGGGAGTAFADFCEAALARVDAFMSTFDPVLDERYGGTAVAGSIGELPDGMNALVTTSAEGTEHQKFVNLMTLVKWNDALEEATPYLAESWDWGDDGSLTFHLRDDVYWHDGVKTTAEDVAFTFERATNLDVPFANATFWEFYEKQVEVVDSFTVRFRLSPHQEPLDPWRAMAIMPKHLLEDVPPEQLKGHPYGSVCPVGNGPFRFVQHRQDDRWVFEANPAFPDALGGRPFLDRYIYRVIPEPSTLLASLRTGEIDVYIAVKPDQASEIEETEGLHLEVFPWRAFDFVGWNERKVQWADPRVRRAITMATDRQAIVDQLLAGYGTVVEVGIPPMFWQQEAVEGLGVPFDQAGARALLDEAGWIDRDGDGVRENEAGDRLEGTLLYNDGNDIRKAVAEIMQVRLAEVGIRVQPQVLEFGTLISRITDTVNRDFDAVVLGWVTEFRLDDRDIFHSDRVNGPYAFSGTRDPELDRYLDTLQLIQTPAEALPVWRSYAERLLEVHPYTYLFSSRRILGVTDRMIGVEGDARGSWVNVARWRIDPAQR